MQVAKQMNRLRRKAENKKFLSSDSLYSKSEATLDRCESHSDTNHAEGVTTNASTGVKTSAASAVGTEAVYFRSSVSKGAHGHDSFHLESHNTGPYGKLDAPATTLDAETLFSMHEIGTVAVCAPMHLYASHAI